MSVVPSHALGTARMADGTTLRTLHWEPASEPWAIAELVHGLGENLGRWRHWLVPKAARILPSMATPHDLPKGGLSRDPAVEARSAADPMCGTKSTLRFAAEAFGEQDRLREVLAGLGAMPVP